MVTSGGPYYARLADIDFGQARRDVDEVFWCLSTSLTAPSARCARAGMLLFIGGTGGRRRALPDMRKVSLRCCSSAHYIGQPEEKRCAPFSTTARWRRSNRFSACNAQSLRA